MSLLHFERADGFIACTFCGATYSKVLGICPGCNHEEIHAPDPTLKGQYQCTQGLPCEQGGEDGVCCVSCNKFGTCPSPCFTAETLDIHDEVTCEFIQGVVK